MSFENYIFAFSSFEDETYFFSLHMTWRRRFFCVNVDEEAIELYDGDFYASRDEIDESHEMMTKRRKVINFQPLSMRLIEAMCE